MKIFTKTIYPLVLLILSLLSGCTYNYTVTPNQLTKIPINGTFKTINITQNGIGINFCLLNSQEQPATVFSQGENFKFYLAIKNKFQRDTATYIINNFLGNPDLFRVYKENGTVIGKPWKLQTCLDISDENNSLPRGKTWILESPWNVNGIPNPAIDSSLMRHLQCYFEGLNQPMLPPGKYYTKLTQQFQLGIYINPFSMAVYPADNYLRTDTLKLKINFEIK